MVATTGILRRARITVAILVAIGIAAANPTHTVVPGDTLFDLARTYETSIDELMRLNDLSSNMIRVGQVLTVGEQQHRPGFQVHTTVEGEDLDQVAASYGLEPWTLAVANPEAGTVLLPGTVLVVPPNDGVTIRVEPGETLLSIATRNGLAPSELAQANGIAGPEGVVEGELLLIPRAVTEVELQVDARPTHRDRQTEVLARFSSLLSDFDRGSATFTLPVGGRLTSSFGWRNISVGGNRFHAGVDLASDHGTAVQAARDGVVQRTGWIGAYGLVVFVDHGDGTQTRYAHLSVIEVSEGASVRQGDILGRVGSTGASTGPHLHFELRLAGRAVDPLPYLDR